MQLCVQHAWSRCATGVGGIDLWVTHQHPLRIYPDTGIIKSLTLGRGLNGKVQGANSLSKDLIVVVGEQQGKH